MRSDHCRAHRACRTTECQQVSFTRKRRSAAGPETAGRGAPSMSVRPPLAEPREPDEPSNRWPWVALALGVLIVLIAVAFFLFNRQRSVEVTVEPTLSPVARAVSPVPPTLVPPTLPASATLAPTATSVPSATPLPV